MSVRLPVAYFGCVGGGEPVAVAGVAPLAKEEELVSMLDVLLLEGPEEPARGLLWTAKQME